MSLSSRERARYARHLALEDVGEAGQERLKSARIRLVGAGGLGSPAALYLAAAGVGTLGIVDADQVEVSNLQRQVLHGTAAIGRPKVESAAARLADLNPDLTLELFPERLTASNASEILGRFDLALDGSDNFPTRYLVNDASILLGRPYIYGSIFRFAGQVSVFGAAGGPCYRCLFPDPPELGLIPNCAEAGVLGVVPGVIGTLQATEAIKLVLSIGAPLVGRLLMYDALAATMQEVAIDRNPDCPACGNQPSLDRLIDYDAFCGVARAGPAITVEELAGVRSADLLVLDVREPWEWELVRIEGSRLLPLGDLPARLGELPRNGEIVTVCHHGLRSQAAQSLLAEAGFKARSLTGGIDAWAERIERDLPRY
ncbi:MAG: molybdopterin-synthase adenylyltransferase MoeB [Gemmatimonadota bacterium]